MFFSHLDSANSTCSGHASEQIELRMSFLKGHSG
jgi:hypothetical protein